MASDMGHAVIAGETGAKVRDGRRRRWRSWRWLCRWTWRAAFFPPSSVGIPSVMHSPRTEPSPQLAPDLQIASRCRQGVAARSHLDRRAVMVKQTIYPTTHQGVRDLDNPMQEAGWAESTRPQN